MFVITGDEILDVGVAVRPSTRVDAITSLLLAAAATNCPVRLTLLRRRPSETYLSPVNGCVGKPAGGLAGPAGNGRQYVDTDGAPSSTDDSPIGMIHCHVTFRLVSK